jgi:hypothetical protein
MGPHSNQQHPNSLGIFGGKPLFPQGAFDLGFPERDGDRESDT